LTARGNVWAFVQDERPGRLTGGFVTASTAVDRGREARRRLLTAAAELIAQRGWSAVSTRMLAERAGVAAGVVHYHFSSVQALLAEAALAVMREMVERVDVALAEAQTPIEALDLMLGFLEGHDGTDPTSLLFIETYLAATRDEELRSSLSEIVVEFRGRLAERLAALDVAVPDDTAAVLAATIDGVVLHRALGPGLDARDVSPVLSRLIVPAVSSVAVEEGRIS